MGLIRKQAGIDLNHKIEEWIKMHNSSFCSDFRFWGKLRINQETLMVGFTDKRDMIQTFDTFIFRYMSDQRCSLPEYICFETPNKIIKIASWCDIDRMRQVLNEITPWFPNINLVEVIIDGTHHYLAKINGEFIHERHW